jgi:hypothetical protein
MVQITPRQHTEWPDELWFYDLQRHGSRSHWIYQAMDFAEQHRFKRLPLHQALVQPWGKTLTELPSLCREKRGRNR